jgi:hypothetical protein
MVEFSVVSSSAPIARVQGSMHGLMNCVLPMPNNFGTLCNGIQAGFGGLGPRLRAVQGQWNALHLQQAMQALQTLASLGVCQVGEQRGLHNVIIGQLLEQYGQGAMDGMMNHPNLQELQ